MKKSFKILILILVFTLNLMMANALGNDFLNLAKPKTTTTPEPTTEPITKKTATKTKTTTATTQSPAKPAGRGFWGDAAAAMAKTTPPPSKASQPQPAQTKKEEPQPAQTKKDEPQSQPIVKAEVLKKTGNIIEMLIDANATSFLQLLQRGNLEEQLKGSVDFTVFAPTNEAIAGIPKWGLRKIAEDPNMLVLMLAYHIAPGKNGAANFTNGLKIPTAYSNRPVHVGVYTNRTSVNHAIVTIPDIIATNGVVHVISRTLFPIPVATLFGILETCHSFSKFKEYIVNTGLEALLKFEGNSLTIFVPTNDAFETIAGTTKAILGDVSGSQESAAKIQALLLHHIIKGAFFSPAFKDGEEVVTAGGKEVLLRVQSDRLREVGVASVIRPDISTINGVIHAIDRFLVHDEIC